MGPVASLKATMMRQAGKFVSRIVRNADEEGLAKLFKTIAMLTKEPAKSGLKKLGRLAEEGHPMLKSWVRVFRNASPASVEKIINNLIINEWVIGEKVRQEKMHEHKVVIPKLVVISPTYACNLNCVGCYAGLYGRKYQLTKEEMESILKQANELGIYFFVITGGEPFIWPHMMEIFEEFIDSYFLVYTNGTLLNEEKVKKLAELGNVTPAVSVEGFERETDWRRGQGVWAKIQKSWELMRKYGVVFGTSVTATKMNHDVIMKDEFWNFLAFVADFWNHGFLTNGCLAAGAKYLHINAKGYVEPCVFQQFAVDNIREKTLLEILKSPFFTAYKRMIPYSTNLFRPCPIIDNPKVFRAMVKKFNAIPQHPGSERVITELADALDKMAEEWRKYADKLWYDIGYSEKYPSNRGVYDYEVRLRRYANNEEKLAVEKKS